MALPVRERGKCKKGGKNGKESHTASRASVETAESTDTKVADRWQKHPKPQGKDQGKARSKQSIRRERTTSTMTERGHPHFRHSHRVRRK